MRRFDLNSEVTLALKEDLEYFLTFCMDGQKQQSVDLPGAYYFTLYRNNSANNFFRKLQIAKMGIWEIPQHLIAELV